MPDKTKRNGILIRPSGILGNSDFLGDLLIILMVSLYHEYKSPECRAHETILSLIKYSKTKHRSIERREQKRDMEPSKIR